MGGMGNNRYSLGSGPLESLTAAEACDQIKARVNDRFDNQDRPHDFVDWQSAIQDRDATIAELGAAVSSLCNIVKDLAPKD